jgi:hypothetical protein
LAQEIKNLDDGFVIDLGCQLSEGGDKGLEKGVLSFS